MLNHTLFEAIVFDPEVFDAFGVEGGKQDFIWVVGLFYVSHQAMARGFT